ncbi:MAG: aldehyde ferredoxin oxidoreductase family protein [Zestosphaera sp.]
MRCALVDLYKESVEYGYLNEKYIRMYLGGRGIASLILYAFKGFNLDPFSPDNVLIISTGLLTGTIPGAARTIIGTKSPATFGIGYSAVGGSLGFYLRKNLIDVIILRNTAKKPVFLVIRNNEVLFEDASDFWGLSVYETRRRIIRFFKEVPLSTALIGPAGENKVRFASIIVDEGRAAARTGVGAVMGSKKVKGLIVVGTGEVPVLNREEFRKLSANLSKKAVTNPAFTLFKVHGTMSLIPIKQASGDLPAYNHQRGDVDDISRIDPEYVHKTLGIRSGGCVPCPIRCGRLLRYKSENIEALEYETMDSLGPLIGVLDVQDILYLNYLVNDYGLDSISTGKVIAWVMECHQRGLAQKILPPIKWGEVERIVEVINAIAFRKDYGNILAEGVKKASEIVGEDTEKYAMHVKGLEIPAQEPRAVKNFALGHATSNRGADHLYALPCISYPHMWEKAKKYLQIPEEHKNIFTDNTEENYKALVVYFSEHLAAVSDALGLCKFYTNETLTYELEDIVTSLRVVAGINISERELLEIGERIVNLERLYLLKSINKAEDVLPERFIREKLPLPTRKESVVNLEVMLKEYYSLRGWSDDGVPRTETLERLKIEEEYSFDDIFRY